MTATEVQTKQKVELSPIKMWKVVFLNDDKTPMDFVVAVLTNMFNHDMYSAEQITMAIHTSGRGVVGVYTREIAEQKVHETLAVAKANGFPLVAVAEES